MIWSTPGEQRRREQVLQPVVLDQRDHQQRHRARRGGDHAGPSAEKGGDHRDAERGIKPNLRINTRDDGERDGLGNQRQRDDDAREQIRADIGEPFLFDCLPVQFPTHVALVKNNRRAGL